jgi:hypothetical protein
MIHGIDLPVDGQGRFILLGRLAALLETWIGFRYRARLMRLFIFPDIGYTHGDLHVFLWVFSHAHSVRIHRKHEGHFFCSNPSPARR